MFLSGQVFEFCDPRIWVLIREIDHGNRLVLFLIQCLELELKGAVGKLAINEIKILVDRPGKDQLPIGNHINDLLVIGVEHNLNVGMIQHLFE